MKILVNNVKEKLIAIYYYFLAGRWNCPANLKDGYTIILPVGPKFYPIMEYNLRFLTSCNLSNCDQILIVSYSKEFYSENMFVINKYSRKIKIKYVVPTVDKRWLLKIQQPPRTKYTSNLITGTNESITEYIYFHDLDFFITDKNHIEELFAQGRKENLNLISTYTRDYDLGKSPATFELLVKRDFMISKPPFTLFACNISGRWFPTFMRFYLHAKSGAEKLMDKEGVGIHFKHLFEELWLFENEKDKFIDSKYSVFLSFVLNSSNCFIRYPLVKSIDGYFSKVVLLKTPYFEKFENDFLNFLNNPVILEKEKNFMLSSFGRLKEKMKSTSSA